MDPQDTPPPPESAQAYISHVIFREGITLYKSNDGTDGIAQNG